MRRAIAILTMVLVTLCFALGATAFADQPGEPQDRGGAATAVAAPLPDATSRAALPRPGAILEASECETCHADGGAGYSHPGAGAAGGGATCTECHGTDHEVIVAADGRVLDGVCGGCHTAQYGD